MVILTLLSFGVWKKKQLKKAANMASFTDLEDVENAILEDDAVGKVEDKLESSEESIEMKLENYDCSSKRKIVVCSDGVTGGDAKRFKDATLHTSSESDMSAEDVKIEVFSETDNSSASSNSPDSSNKQIVAGESRSEDPSRSSFNELFRQKYPIETDDANDNEFEDISHSLAIESEVHMVGFLEASARSRSLPFSGQKTYSSTLSENRQVLYESDDSTHSSDSPEIIDELIVKRRSKSQGSSNVNFAKLFVEKEEDSLENRTGEKIANRKIIELGKRPEQELYRPGSFSAKKQSRKDDVLPQKKVQTISNMSSSFLDLENDTGIKLSHTKMYNEDILPDRVSRDTSSDIVFDTHCHLDFCGPRLSRDVDTLEKMLEVDGEGMSLYTKGGSGKFGGCIAIYCDPKTWGHELLHNAKQKGVYVGVGCHPHFVESLSSDALDMLESFVSAESRGDNLVALGEIGLDYSSKNSVKKDDQKKAFRMQLKLALKHRLPVVLHIRDAEEDGYQVLKEAGVPASYPLHLHCFTGDWAEAKRWLRKFPASVIGLTGVVTFSSATKVHEVAREIPLDRLLLETDAPYFLPKSVDRAKYKDSVCLPGHVIHTAERIAQIRGDSVKNILQANLKNVERIYGVKMD